MAENWKILVNNEKRLGELKNEEYMKQFVWIRKGLSWQLNNLKIHWLICN